eukprot:TRINITY_DN11432_c0_g1_i5.p1 TRINITY_DN11432_c0_g1~~TRINITY_DN11432_c0_g1_i5.p1  ORF type:complete len:356 (-),score=72.12 TRINITY_DN11432_c0_g1_i5:44-952(-)
MLNSRPRRSKNGKGQVTIDQFPFAVQPTEDDPLGLHCLLASQSHGADFTQLNGASQNAVSAVRAMLSFEERDRPGPSACLRLPWFQDLPDRSVSRLSQPQVQLLVERSKRDLRTFSDLLVAKAASQLPSSRLTVYEQQFKAIDVRGKGYIDRSEMAQTLHQLRVCRQDAERAADAMDLSRTGCISWSEFVAALLPTSENLLHDGLAAVFSQLDLNDDGFVSAVELAEALMRTSCDLAFSKFVAEIILKEIDHVGDGKLKLNDVKKLALGREACGGTSSRSLTAIRKAVPAAISARKKCGDKK